jgi:hypothetical protein
MDKALLKETDNTINETFENFIKTNGKPYNNDNIKNRICINFPLLYLTEIACYNKHINHLFVCQNTSFLNYYSEIFSKYFGRDSLIEKLNDKYYEVFSLLYLIEKHENTCNLFKFINSFDTIENLYDNFIISIVAPDVYRQLSRQITNKIKIKYENEFCGIVNETYLIQYNYTVLDIIKNCSKIFIVLPITINRSIYGHANILIFNSLKREVEIFDPDFQKDSHDDQIYSKFAKKIFPEDVEYVSQNEYITHAIQDIQQKECTDQIGQCAAWTIWYCDNRLQKKYQDKTAKEAFQMIIKEHIEGNDNLSETIRKYVDFVKKQRKDVLASKNISENIKKILKDEWKME